MNAIERWPSPRRPGREARGMIVEKKTLLARRAGFNAAQAVRPGE